MDEVSVQYNKAQKAADVICATINAMYPSYETERPEGEHDWWYSLDGLDQGIGSHREDVCDNLAAAGYLAGMSGSFQVLRVMSVFDAAEMMGLLDDLGTDDPDEDAILDVLTDREDWVIVPPDTECEDKTYVLLLKEGT